MNLASCSARLPRPSVAAVRAEPNRIRLPGGAPVAPIHRSTGPIRCRLVLFGGGDAARGPTLLACAPGRAPSARPTDFCAGRSTAADTLLGAHLWHGRHGPRQGDLQVLLRDRAVSCAPLRVLYLLVGATGVWLLSGGRVSVWVGGGQCAGVSPAPALAPSAHGWRRRLTRAGRRAGAKRPGAEGHEFQDAQTYADWGVDYLKARFLLTVVGIFRRATSCCVGLALRTVAHPPCSAVLGTPTGLARWHPRPPCRRTRATPLATIPSRLSSTAKCATGQSRPNIPPPFLRPKGWPACCLPAWYTARHRHRHLCSAGHAAGRCAVNLGTCWRPSRGKTGRPPRRHAAPAAAPPGTRSLLHADQPRPRPAG